jgi:hypothetical protein
MKTFTFTHYYEISVPEFKGPPSSWADAYVKRLGEIEGGPDFSVGSGRAGVLAIQFAREAESAASAYASSISDVLRLLPEAIPIWSEPNESWWPVPRPTEPLPCKHCGSPLEWWEDHLVWICPCLSVPKE